MKKHEEVNVMEEQYGELAKRIGMQNSERIAKLFKMIADPAEAELLLALPGNVKECLQLVLGLL